MSGLIDKAFDPRDGAMMMKSMQKKWRESFPGAALDPARWDVVLGSGMSIVVSAGTLTINTGIDASSETIITSKESFLVPFRVMAAFNISQRIINQEFYVEMVSVDELSETPDDLNVGGWRFQGTTSTVGDYIVKNAGGTTQALASGTIGATSTYGILEIEPFVDECWFHTRTLDSVGGRVWSGVRHRDIPEPNARYKLRIRAKNLAVAPASTTAFNFLFAACSDYMELTTEITAARGGSSSGQGLAVNVANTPSVSSNFAPSTASGGVATYFNLTSAATTNGTLVKSTAAALLGIHASNTSASWRFLKFYNKATAAVPGTDTMLFYVGIPPGQSININPAGQYRFSVGLSVGITGGMAGTDATVVGAGEVMLTLAYA